MFKFPYRTVSSTPPPISGSLLPGTGLGSGSIAPLFWQDYFENVYIPSSLSNKTRNSQTIIPSMAGAYRTLPINGNVDWYFSNMAMLNYVGTPNYIYNGDLGAKNIDVQQRVKEYMNRYLAFVSSTTCTIVNKSINNATLAVADVLEDSHDSYISTFLMLFSVYNVTYADTTWYSTNLPKVKAMANALVANIDSSKKLTPNFFFQPPLLTGSYMPQFYCEDNFESHAGLLAFGQLLQQMSDSSSSTYLNAAANIKQGIESELFNSTANRYEWSIEKAPTYGFVAVFNPSLYYPNWQCQGFASLYDTSVNTTQLTSAFNALDAGFPNWKASTQAGFNSTFGAYPDGFLAQMAAKRNLVTEASNVISRTEAQRAAFSYVAIHDIAWAAKAKKTLNI
jgi:hypothetical protein